MFSWKKLTQNFTLSKLKKNAAPRDASASSIVDHQRQTFQENLWAVIFVLVLAVWLVPTIFFIPQLHDSTQATFWLIDENVDTVGTVGQGSSMVLNGSGLPSIVYKDVTNSKDKYATRNGDGSWTIEDIENGISSPASQNIKSDIALDPTDNKVSAVYCQAASPSTGPMRYAHRVGDGTGNCGTSNNWQCSTILSDCSAVQMISLAFHSTSTQPTVSYIDGASGIHRLFYGEYNGSAWTLTLAQTYDGWLSQSKMETAHTFTTSGEPIIYYGSADSGRRLIKYVYRKAADWIWQTPVIIDNATAAAGYTTSTNVSLIKAGDGIIHGAYSMYGPLRYLTMNGLTVTTSTVDATVSSTWTSIALTNGLPAIAYHEETNLDLKYSVFNGASWASETVSSTGRVGENASLVMSNNSPVISYFDRTNANLSFVSATTFNSAPSAPTTLYSNSSTAQSGLANPTNLATGTPAFSALFIDTDLSDTAQKAEIQITTTTDDFATITHWDSGLAGTTFTPATANGARSIDFHYNNFGAAATNAIGIADDGTEGGVNTLYYWRIRFWDASTAGAWATSSTFSILDVPAAPSAVSGSLAETAATVTWTDNSSIEQNFELAYSTDDITYTYAASTSADIITADASGLTPNSLYYLKVRAFNLAGYSTYATATSGYTLANVPINPVVSSPAYDQVNFTWDANSNPVGTEYYALNVTAGTNSGLITSTNTTFTGLEGAKSYTFQVRARNTQLISTSYTSVVATTTLPNTPSTPSVTQSGNSAILSWGANGNSASAVYEAVNVTTGQTVGSLSSPTHTFSNLIFGSTYQFKVRAVNSDAIVSPYTDTVSISLATPAGGASSQGKIAQQEQQISIAQDTITGSLFITSTLEGLPKESSSSTHVFLNITYSDNVADMMVSNQPDFEGVAWAPATKKIPWDIVGGDGPRTVYVKFRSKKLNVSDVYAHSIKLDQIAPGIPHIVSPTINAALTNEKPSYSGYSELGSHVMLSLYNSASDKSTEELIGGAITNGSGAWLFASQVPLPTGSYILSAVAYDEAGNASKPHSIKFSVIDNTPPTAPIVTFPTPHQTVMGTVQSTAGFAEPKSKIIIVRDNSLTYSTQTQNDGTWKFDFVAPFTVGTYTLEYYAVDASGNQSPKIIVPFTTVAPPVIVPIEPIKPIKEKLPPPTKIEPKKVIQKVQKTPVLAIPTMPQTLNPVPPSEPAVITELQAVPIVTTPDVFVVPHQEPAATPPAQPLRLLSAAGTVLDGVSAIAQDVAIAIKQTAKIARQIADTPQVQTANKAVVVPVTSLAVASTVVGVVNASQYFVYLKYLFTQPLFLLRQRRRKGWGTVYNAFTKMPVDLAVVRIVDSKTNRVIQSSVTDRLGRFQFFMPAGEFAIELTKQDHAFPPSYLKDQKEDGKYIDLYTGGNFQLSQPTAVRYNIPLDPAGTAKPSAQILKDATKKWLAQIVGLSGVIIAGISYVITPVPLVGVFFLGHITSYFIFRRLAITKKPRTWGIVSDGVTKKSVEKAVVRIFDTKYNKLLDTQVTDSKGHYGFLVGKNEYYVIIERAGYKKHVSQPVKIENEAEGGVVGFDVNLLQEDAPQNQQPQGGPGEKQATAIFTRVESYPSVKEPEIKPTQT